MPQPNYAPQSGPWNDYQPQATSAPPDLSRVYSALQKADAAGDTASAKQLADYIRSQTGPWNDYQTRGTPNPFDQFDTKNPFDQFDAPRLDLSKFSDSDLQALAAGDLRKVSDAGLHALNTAASAAARTGTGQSWLDQQSSVVRPQDMSWLDAGSSPVGGRYGTGQSFDATRQGLVPSGSPEAIAARGPLANVAPDVAHPVTGEISDFLRNAVLGAGKLYTDVGLGARQIGAQIQDRLSAPTLASLITGQSRYDALQQEAADKRATDAAIMSTGGGKAGFVAGALPVLALPGANTYAGAAVLGGGMGALQPTAPGESRTVNTVLNAGTNLGGQFTGNVLGKWLTSRAAQPFMGWKPSTFDSTLASAVGSDASKLTPEAINAAHQRLTGIFRQVRSPNVTTTLGQPSADALSTISANLNPSARAAFEANPNVTDLMDAVTAGRPISAQQLGSISTGLRQDASSALNAEGGNREAGLALRALREHVDDVVGSTITDPGLAAAYAAARPQYGTLMDAIDNPTLLKAATGRANATAWGNYLQRNDPMGYSTGVNQSPLYQGARWGQATGEGKGPPPMLRHFGLDWLGYRTLNNPISNAIGGTVSRIGASAAPYLPVGLQGLALGGTPILKEEVEDFFDQ